ncbi:hypothetical protein BTV98_07565 [Psychrobacter sp. Cmf 22.2]|nr:hypothetical protein BTV98_07565 [Psychrobacter sp. Cmf 22.2]
MSFFERVLVAVLDKVGEGCLEVIPGPVCIEGSFLYYSKLKNKSLSIDRLMVSTTVMYRSKSLANLRA